MDRVDFEFEKFLISEALSLALQDLNLVVRAFQGHGGPVAIILRYTLSRTGPSVA
jgi:hypothetical protein